MSKHRHENGQQSIGHAAEGTTVGTTARAQPGIEGRAHRIVPGTDLGPVVDGIAQARITPAPHRDAPALPALFGDGRTACLRAEGVVVSRRQGPRGLGEHRGADLSPDSRQGPEDGHVTMLLGLPQFIEQLLQPRRTGLLLLGR